MSRGKKNPARALRRKHKQRDHSSSRRSNGGMKGRGVDENSVEYWRHDKCYELGVAVLRGFLSKESCSKLRTAHSFGEPINDRHDELNFRHQVWRIEQGAERVDWCKRILSNLYAAMEAVDSLYWRQLARCEKYHPEVELIKYLVKREAQSFPALGLTSIIRPS